MDVSTAWPRAPGPGPRAQAPGPGPGAPGPGLSASSDLFHPSCLPKASKPWHLAQGRVRRQKPQRQKSQPVAAQKPGKQLAA